MPATHLNKFGTGFIFFSSQHPVNVWEHIYQSPWCFIGLYLYRRWPLRVQVTSWIFPEDVVTMISKKNVKFWFDCWILFHFGSVYQWAQAVRSLDHSYVWFPWGVSGVVLRLYRVCIFFTAVLPDGRKITASRWFSFFSFVELPPDSLKDFMYYRWWNVQIVCNSSHRNIISE